MNKKQELTDEICAQRGLVFRSGHAETAAQIDAFEQPRHVFTQGAHGLHPFVVLTYFLGGIAMHLLLEMVKYLFSRSKAALAPPRRQDTTLAPSLPAIRFPPE